MLSEVRNIIFLKYNAVLNFVFEIYTLINQVFFLQFRFQRLSVLNFYGHSSKIRTN